MILTTRANHILNKRCQEYKNVMRHLSIQQKLQIYSLGKIKLNSKEEILEWCYAIDKLLGFEDVEILFPKKLKIAAATPYMNRIKFTENETLYVIIHEYAHLLAPLGANHGIDFVKALIELIDIFLNEYNDLKIYSLEDMENESLPWGYFPKKEIPEGIEVFVF